MKVAVTVKPSGAPVPLSPSQVTAKALTETSAAWAKAKPLAAAPVPANTVYAGVGSTTAILGFFPRVLKVKAGTTVNFVNRSPSEVHNVDVRAGEVPARVLQEDRPAPGRPGQPEPGHAALPVRHRAEGRLHVRRQEPRQRVPVDTAHGGLATRAAAEGGEGDVHRMPARTSTSASSTEATWPER